MMEFFYATDKLVENPFAVFAIVVNGAMQQLALGVALKCLATTKVERRIVSPRNGGHGQI